MKTVKQIFSMIYEAEEAKSPRLLPLEKFWFKSGGGFVPMEPHENENHHVFKPVTQPEKFGLETKDILDMKPKVDLRLISSGYASWNDNIIREMNNRGHFRGMYSYTPSVVTKNNVFPATHHFTLSDDRAWNSNYAPQDLTEYHDHLEHVLTSVPKHEDVNITLDIATGKLDPEFKEKLKNKHQAVVSGGKVKFVGRESVESYLKDVQAKRRRDAEEQTRSIGSTEIRQALGKNKPAGMTAAEWNFFRTLGDSYTPIMIMKKLINEMSLRRKKSK
jgi:hypothetical protein